MAPTITALPRTGVMVERAEPGIANQPCNGEADIGHQPAQDPALVTTGLGVGLPNCADSQDTERIVCA